MNDVALFLVFLITAAVNSAAAAQAEREFLDRDRGYRITLVGDWQPVSYTDAVGRQKTEFVFRRRNDGVLAITREGLPRGSLADKVDVDLSDMKQCYACLFTSKETFGGGQLSGFRALVYYHKDGRKIAGAYYYLQDGNAVWILRFNADPASPGIAREVTDRMARSFSPPPPTPFSPQALSPHRAGSGRSALSTRSTDVMR